MTAPGVREELVSVLPVGHLDREMFTVAVSWRGGDRYAVTWLGHALGSDGWWSAEGGPDERDAGWLASHRFGYDEALRLAEKVCRTLTVGGVTVAQLLAGVR